MVGCNISPSPHSTRSHQRKYFIFLVWESSQFCPKAFICPKGGKLLSLAQGPAGRGRVGREREPEARGGAAHKLLAGAAAVGHSSASRSAFGKSRGATTGQPYKPKRKYTLRPSWTIQPSATSSLLLCWFSRKALLTLIFTCSLYHALSRSHCLIHS